MNLSLIKLTWLKIRIRYFNRKEKLFVYINSSSHEGLYFSITNIQETPVSFCHFTENTVISKYETTTANNLIKCRYIWDDSVDESIVDKYCSFIKINYHKNSLEMGLNSKCLKSTSMVMIIQGLNIMWMILLSQTIKRLIFSWGKLNDSTIMYLS